MVKRALPCENLTVATLQKSKNPPTPLPTSCVHFPHTPRQLRNEKSKKISRRDVVTFRLNNLFCMSR